MVEILFFSPYHIARSGLCEQHFLKTYESEVSLWAKLYSVGLGFFLSSPVDLAT